MPGVAAELQLCTPLAGELQLMGWVVVCACVCARVMRSVIGPVCVCVCVCVHVMRVYVLCSL